MTESKISNGVFVDEVSTNGVSVDEFSTEKVSAEEVSGGGSAEEKKSRVKKQGVLKIYADDDLTEDLPTIAQAVMTELKQKENFYVDLTFLNKEEIRILNLRERNVDSVTDVLSFPMLDGVRNKIIKKKDFPFDYDEDEKAIFLGSVAICKERAAEQAKEYGHSERREITYLIVHALMHLFGYDHMIENDKKEMRAKEENVMNALGVTR